MDWFNVNKEEIVEISEAYAKELRKRTDLEIVDEPSFIQFNNANNLMPLEIK